MSSSDNLRTAKQTANDEFYTDFTDIQKEVLLYLQNFKDKVVYCNCDSEKSNFWKFFLYYKKRLGIKMIWRSSFDDKYRIGWDGYSVIKVPIKTGDCFHNQEFLFDVDIVVTNPPFSLFRPFMEMLWESKVEYLILGSQNALSYNNVFKKIQQDKLWLGYHYGTFEFEVPAGYEKNVREKNGRRYTKLGNICWFTNLPNKARNKPMILSKEKRDFARYDNYDAVEIPQVLWIPENLEGRAGVPITFLNRYCPEQFKIIGKSDSLAGPIPEKEKPGRFYLNGKRLYERVVIERR